MTTLRGVYTIDAIMPPAEYRRAQQALQRRMQDEVLSAQPVGKVLAMGKVWTGTLAPEIDLFVAKVEQLTRGFILNHVVGPEGPGMRVDLGTVWDGAAAIHNLLGAAAASYRSTGDAVNIAEVIREVESLREMMGTNDPEMISDAIRRVKRARDALPSRTTADSYRAAVRDEYAHIASLNVASRARHAQNTTQTRDSQSAVRDAQYRVASASNTRDQMAARNALNRAFWAAHPIDTHARGRR